MLNYCPEIPSEIRQELLRTQKDKSSAGGGRKYWAEGAKALGVYQDGYGLRFRPLNEESTTNDPPPAVAAGAAAPDRSP